jgi:glutathione S-transferase
VCSGQAAWFTKFHHEQIPSAKERYNKELNRITGVLESVLARHEKEYSHSAGFDGPWLVGNKFSFADLVFVSWQKIIAFIVLEDQYDINNYPHVKAWMDKMLARDTIKGVIDRSVAVSRAEQSRKQDS